MNRKAITILFDDKDFNTVISSAEFSQQEMLAMIYGWDPAQNPDGTVLSISGRAALSLQQHVLNRVESAELSEPVLENLFQKPRNRHERRKMAKTGER